MLPIKSWQLQAWLGVFGPGEAEQHSCSLSEWLFLPLDSRVDAGSMDLVRRLSSLGAVLAWPLVHCQHGMWEQPAKLWLCWRQHFRHLLCAALSPVA